MCYGCYKEFGSPKIVNERTLAAAKLIDQIYERSCVGGNAHIVVDDWNLGTASINWCLTEAMAENIHEADSGQLAVERACLEALLALTLEERASAMAIHEGWVEVDKQEDGPRGEA